MIQAGFDFLYFIAGIFMHMSLLHLFSFYETEHHPMISRAENPYLASKLWGVVQMALGISILAFTQYQFGKNLPTLFLFLGFGFWAIFFGIASGSRYKRRKSSETF